MRVVKEMGEVTNRAVFNKLRKLFLSQKSLIKCDRCPYNKGENVKRQARSDRYKNKV